VNTFERPVRRWWVTSDHHLEPGGQPATCHSGEFARFLHALADSGRAGLDERVLLLLGDTFELMRPPNPAPDQDGTTASLDRLRAILSDHRAVADALRKVLAADIRVVVVPGNHDMDLLRPAVADEMRSAIGAGPGQLVVQPWFVLIPGVLYAEHGNQHHEINRFPDPLRPVQDDGRIFAPTAAWLGSMRAADDVVTRARIARHAIQSLWRSAAHLPSSDPGNAIGRIVADTGLAPRAVLGLLSCSRSAAPVMVTRTLTRRLRGGDSHAYMLNGAVRTANVLARHGALPPLMIFGHVHDTADRYVPGHPSRYLNSGTWSSLARGRQLAEFGTTGMPYLDVRIDGHGVNAQVCWWQADSSGANAD
jgi:UDP-2,3-diacylglucosamine pyrophosphatase LpxH